MLRSDCYKKMAMRQRNAQLKVQRQRSGHLVEANVLF
ncbi:conserved hypothetical protein [Vibrio cholerae O1 str. 2010EL-1786]|uniref:Uncharacterized protein n=2 Tax=Vibrio cholerae TaxID=666 RepID=Q9KUZ5_VIBCH|nr:hypothetical protein VC_0363 [Vibrio cholerae O1 biovar El Tor str. N16961]ACP04675.1 conserved hypothetical protein [Vibrio cholerae M66-2]ACP08429.1 conserved hypothetical protein [Vibrio cholerae O395]AET28211.1 conserved hypothetical protein [Vibrio cholerae O1 str. 2010EL-1786]